MLLALIVRRLLMYRTCYRRFIKSFSARAKPLSDFLKKTVEFEWNQQKSFNDLRSVLCQALVLQRPNFEEPFILTPDSSDYA